jgi:hypothetical protein
MISDPIDHAVIFIQRFICDFFVLLNEEG